MQGLIGLPTLIAGVVLMVAGTHWFSNAYTVGLILTIASSVVILLGLIAFVAIVTGFNKARKW